MTDELFAVYNNGMPGIVSALKSHNNVRKFRQKIDDFTFAFITPLGSDNYDVGHVLLLFNLIV